MSFNVLISSAGRRVVLLRLFREALKDLDLGGRILAVDCSRTAPAFHEADLGVQVPRCTDSSFLGIMLDLCRSESVNLIVPTIDLELPVYAAARDDFVRLGATVAVSSPDMIAICADKVLTNRWLQDNGFPTVRQWYGAGLGPDDADFPVVVKPRFGSASIGLSQARERVELQVCMRRASDPVIEAIAPGAEYTVNVLVGRKGKVLAAVPHQRLEVRSGEVSKGITVKRRDLIEVASRLGETLPGAFGALNFQGFLDSDGAFRIIEINGRFGGGYPLAHRAGVNFPRWLIEETLALESTPRFDDWEDGLAMLRYDEAVFVRREAIE